MGTSFAYGKSLAGEGALLLIFGVVPYVGWVLGIIGVILFMKGIRELSNYYQDNEIYQNSLTGVKYYIIALVAIAVTAVVAAAGFVIGHRPLIASVAGIVGLIIAFIFYILAATHLRRTFDTLAQKSGEHIFATAGALLWWGSILTIILVGLLLIFLAWLLAVIGFFTMRPQQQPQNSYTPPSSTPPSPPASQPQQMARFCPNCGASTPPDATYCPHCGKPLTT